LDVGKVKQVGVNSKSGYHHVSVTIISFSFGKALAISIIMSLLQNERLRGSRSNIFSVVSLPIRNFVL
jgi:hypothetical protein